MAHSTLAVTVDGQQLELHSKVYSTSMKTKVTSVPKNLKHDAGFNRKQVIHTVLVNLLTINPLQV